MKSASWVADHEIAELKVKNGVRVDSVEGMAARSGLREGDVILTLDNVEITNARQFNGLVAKAGLVDTLKGTGPFTVFAPSNEAFAKVPAATMQALAADPAKLKAVLTYHVVAGKVMAADVKNGNSKTVNGANLALSKAGEFVTVEDALVQTADISATNGVVHIVDSVLIPPVAR